jgi:hypothetical protein
MSTGIAKIAGSLSACVIVSLPAAADLPPLGGDMNHVLVTLTPDRRFVLAVEHPGEQVLIEGPEVYTGAAAVLNGTRFNAQYGWLVNGLWAPPPGGFVYMESVQQSPGLAAYAGRAFGPYSFMDPLFGTAGAPPRMVWDGVMLHDYYAATTPGHYAATYRVYMGDAAGVPLAGYEPGEITLGWVWETACAADLAEPFGVLDLSDITAFVGAFVAGLPAADLAEPFGLFDLADLSAFANAFVGGCP